MGLYNIVSCVWLQLFLRVLGLPRFARAGFLGFWWVLSVLVGCGVMLVGFWWVAVVCVPGWRVVDDLISGVLRCVFWVFDGGFRVA